jgi:signal transduction histidine kinase
MNASAVVSTFATQDRTAKQALKPEPSSASRIHLYGLAAIVIASLSLAGVTASECHSIFYFPSSLYGFVLWGWWGCLASLLWTIGFTKPSILRASPIALVGDGLAGCGLGVVHLLLLGSLGFMSEGWQKHSTARAVWTSMLSVNRFGLEILIFGFVLGMIGIVQSQLRAQRDAMRSLELEKQLSEAQLRALQMQLEPHFLFNTLNAITTLVELGRQEEAAEMLGHLNAILKSTLKRTTPQKVPLSQELEVMENYLAIEQIRFADRLRIEIKVEPSTLDSLVPCFLLQPIVENAIRHGIAQCEGDGLVEASARRDGDFLRLEVRDSGSGTQTNAKPGSGIGLKNTRERLAHFYRDGYTMRAQPMERGGYEVAIAIPYERS